MIVETNLPNLLHRGKVRDTYDLSGGYLLMVATDRVSAFDVVLPSGIPHKGLVLSKISAFWFQKAAHLVDNHYVASADDPEVAQRYGFGSAMAQLDPQIARQAMVVKKAQRLDVECIVRGYLAGSAWAEYRKSGTVFGSPMPPGMQEGQRLDQPIFTPTTKAEEGHDQNMSLQDLVALVGEDLAHRLEEKSLEVYLFAQQFALNRDIILADTKMEFGLLDGRLLLIDELLTPDSSRFWDSQGYQPGRSQPNFDKQYVRDWLTSQGWDQEPPAPNLPEEVVHRTSERYLEAYHRLTGEKLNTETS